MGQEDYLFIIIILTNAGKVLCEGSLVSTSGLYMALNKGELNRMLFFTDCSINIATLILSVMILTTLLSMIMMG